LSAGGSCTAAEPDLLSAIEVLLSQAGPLCRPAGVGCGSDCCHAARSVGGRVVAVSLPDLIALATYLYRPTDRPSLQAAVADLLEQYCTRSPHTGSYMLTGNDGGCPFLGEQGACTVYVVRPLLCRVFFHCEYIGGRLHWDSALDERVMRTLHGLAHDLSQHWKGQAGLLWRAPWRSDAIPLAD